MFFFCNVAIKHFWFDLNLLNWFFHFYSSDDFIVQVKAQVMTRDEGTGGWVPFGKGGMSIIGLRRVTIADRDDVTTEYLLHGQRIADKSVSFIY